MEDFGGAPDVDACSVCIADGETTPGTMWCTTCEDVFCEGCIKLHKKMRLLRDHEVLDVRLHGNRKPKVRNLMCRIHKDEKIKLFCKDCRVAMCTVCCNIKHRKCDDVETIDAMMPLVKEALVNETRILEKKIETSNDNISLANMKIEKLTSSAQERKDEVRKVRMAATEVLVRKERELLDLIDKLTETRVQELKTYRKSQDTDLHVEQQQFEFIDKAVTSDCVADMLDMYESVLGASQGADAREDKTPQTSSIFFLHDVDKLMRSVGGVQLGEIKVAGDLREWTSSPVLLETIDFSGNMFHDLRDVVVFVVNGIKVITVIDYVNCRLSTRYVPKAPSLLENLQLFSGPMGIAKLGGNKAAVTLPDIHKIAFIKFDPEPTLQSTVKTNRKYGGLAFLNTSQLAAGAFDGPASVDILDMEGNVLKSINTDVIRHPHYLHHSGENNLLASEGTVRSLVCVTSEGKSVFTYTPTEERALTFPQGITSTSTGDILLVDRDSHKVIHLTESGKFVRDLLTQTDGLHYPTGVYLDGDSVMYVSNSKYVNVYRFAKRQIDKCDVHCSVCP